jgi:hypothetical protein
MDTIKKQNREKTTSTPAMAPRIRELVGDSRRLQKQTYTLK